MTQIHIAENYPYARNYPCRCSNCGARWTSSELHCISDAETRLTPGEETPAGQCPTCHGLVYLEGDT